MTQATTHATTCPYCGVGCGVIATTSIDGSISIKGDKTHPANFGRLCSKGSALADTVGLENRLLYPLVNKQRVSWDTALDKVANGFKHVIDKYGADAVAFYVSGQLLTEDYYVANKLMKGFIGSANIDTNSRLCMSSAVAGYKRAFGADAVPCSYEDLENSHLIVIEGSNTAWCHPVVFQRITLAKQNNPDLKIVVIDPRKTATCEIADLHLPIQSGTDTTLFCGLLQYLSSHGYVNEEFVSKHTEGLTAALIASESLNDIDTIADTCQLAKEDVMAFYRLFAQTEKVVTLYSQGVNQSTSGTDNSNSIINCHLITGRIGQPAMGPFSITGQPNAMGGREVGGLSNQLAAHMDITNRTHHDLVSRFWDTTHLAKQVGAKAVDMFNDVASGKIKAIWIMATNPAVSLPDANKVREALEKCELVVVSDCDLNTDTTQYADVLLPAMGWGEKDGTVTNSERRISHQRGFLKPAGESKADWWIISEVAKRMGFVEQFNYQSQRDIFKEHAALSAFENQGSRDFDLSGLMDITADEYENLKPIQWPINDANPQGKKRLFEDKQFYTPSKKAQFIAITPHQPAHQPDNDYPLILNTGRVRDQWHTMTRTARSAKLNGHIPEPFVEIHPDDADRFNLKKGELAQVESAWGVTLARIEIAISQKRGSVFIPIHWNEQYASCSCVDKVVNPAVDIVSGQPESKHTPVKISTYDAQWYGFVLSREPIVFDDSHYWIRIKGQHFWRYELAGQTALDAVSTWAKSLLGAEGDFIDYSDSGSGEYRAANIKADKLQSVFFVSSNANLPARAWLSQMFAEEVITDQSRMSLLAGKAGAGQPDIGPLVCACFAVGENTIKDAVACGAAKSVTDLGEQLKAGTNCGSCIPELKKFLGG